VRGIVLHYVVCKGFGALRGADGKRYFIFWKNITDEDNGGQILIKNLLVEFEPGSPPGPGKDPIALDIRRKGYFTDKKPKEVQNGEAERV